MQSGLHGPCTALHKWQIGARLLEEVLYYYNDDK